MANPRLNPFLEPANSTWAPIDNPFLDENFFSDVNSEGADRLSSIGGDRMDEMSRLRDEVSGLQIQMQTILQSHRILERQVDIVGRERDLAQSRVTELEGEITRRGRELDRTNRNAREDDRENSRLLASRLEAAESSAAAAYRARPLIKASDIKELRLPNLSSLTSAHELDQWFNQIEACATDDIGRKQVAMNKLEPNARTVLTTRGNVNHATTWESFKAECHKVFDYPVDPVAVVQDINQKFIYNIEDDPRLFINNLNAMISSVRVPNIPNTDLMMKRKLFDGLPQTLRRDLQPYMDDNSIGSAEFLQSVERHRRSYLECKRSAQNIRELTIMKEPSSASQSLTGRGAESAPLYEVVAGLQEKMAEMEKKERKAEQERKEVKPRCGYCNWRERHGWWDCPKKPPKGSCFDCLQTGHKKGEGICPKQQ